MSFVIYGGINCKKVIKAHNIHEACDIFINSLSDYDLLNYRYTIEPLY